MYALITILSTFHPKFSNKTFSILIKTRKVSHPCSDISRYTRSCKRIKITIIFLKKL